MTTLNRSIETRLKIVNVVFFSFILALVTAYSLQVFSFEKKIETMGHLEKFLQDILELRRYENNMLLNSGADDRDNIFIYVKRIKGDLELLQDKIRAIAGDREFDRFRKDFNTYIARLPADNHGLEKLKKSGKVLRPYGESMADFATHLLEKERKLIRVHARIFLYTFTILPGIAVLLVMLTIFRLTRGVVDRLSFLRQAVRDIRKGGKFTPIRDAPRLNDEISDLARSFNEIAAELDSKTDELIQSKKLADIGTFSSGIAHELNNPLNNISLSADMLLEEYDNTPKDEAKEILRDILAQTDRAGNIVRDLLDFTRNKEPVVRKLRVCDVIAGAKKLIENELRLKGVHLETWKQPDLPYILGDEQKLQQVFLNLFVNAIHAMPGGGLIHVDTHAGPQGFIRVDVSDTGAGIPRGKIRNIFDPFFTTRQGGTGTGLGLSIVYEIVKKHGGYIEVESQVQAGTTFSVFLPVAAETEAKDEAGKQA